MSFSSSFPTLSNHWEEAMLTKPRVRLCSVATFQRGGKTSAWMRWIANSRYTLIQVSALPWEYYILSFIKRTLLIGKINSDRAYRKEYLDNFYHFQCFHTTGCSISAKPCHQFIPDAPCISLNVTDSLPTAACFLHVDFVIEFPFNFFVFRYLILASCALVNPSNSEVVPL